MPELVLPHAVLAALWLPHVAGDELPRLAQLPRAAAALKGPAESHVVHPAAAGAQLEPLERLLGRLAATRPAHIGALLPQPGHVAGLPRVVLERALSAEQCLLVAGPEGSWAVVPHAEPYGSHLEPGVLVSWYEVALPPEERPVATLLGAQGTLGEARREVADAVSRATVLLADLADADAPADPRLLRSELPTDLLPPDLDARRVELLARCARLLGIVQLARTSAADATGGAAAARSRALHELEVVARRGLGAASLTVQPASTSR